jgi:hypothetical protein
VRRSVGVDVLGDVIVGEPRGALGGAGRVSESGEGGGAMKLFCRTTGRSSERASLRRRQNVRAREDLQAGLRRGLGVGGRVFSVQEVHAALRAPFIRSLSQVVSFFILCLTNTSERQQDQK